MAAVTRWARSIFLMISSFEKSWIFFEISFASTIFGSSHVFSDCCFLMFLKTSFFLRLLFLRSSTSISNRWMVIAWLLTVSFSSTNLNFKPFISSLFSCVCVLASWAVASTAFSLRRISFVRLSSSSSYDVSLVPSSLNVALSKSLISSKLLLLLSACCSFAFLDGIFSLWSNILLIY